MDKNIMTIDILDEKLEEMIKAPLGISNADIKKMIASPSSEVLQQNIKEYGIGFVQYSNNA